jgi:hypothetical protein
MLNFFHVLLGKDMKRKRDIQGKFSLKNDDYRQIRSVRLTDRTWRVLGIASECLGWTWADLLENLVEHNQGNFPDFPLLEEVSPEFDSITPEKPLNQDNLEVLAETVLKDLRIGLQSSHYKVAKKALKRLIELSSTW